MYAIFKIVKKKNALLKLIQNKNIYQKVYY